MCLTKFDAKMTKMKQNYIVNMIMNVSGTVCQLIHYLPGKQGLANNLPWPAIKSKQRTCIELFVIISFQLCVCVGGGRLKLFYCCIYNITIHDLITNY